MTMALTASLPMYNLPGMRAANAALWSALADRLRATGLSEPPGALLFERPPVPDGIGPEVLFTQTCGYPLQTLYRGQYRLLARPWCEAAGCAGSTHSAFILAPRALGAHGLEDLRGARFALNSLHSNSGMNLPRRLIAEIAGARPFFSRVVETGGHGASIRLLAQGGADCASIDCLTYAFYQDHEPDLVAGLDILARTPPSPSIPFVTSVVTPEPVVTALREALLALPDDPRLGEAMKTLRITRIEPAPEAEYAAILDYEREAAGLGYPDLI